eukprot:6617803-Pyramimonas_sp.AAC.1
MRSGATHPVADVSEPEEGQRPREVGGEKVLLPAQHALAAHRDRRYRARAARPAGAFRLPDQVVSTPSRRVGTRFIRLIG